MVAVISGATRGLGKALALALAKEGYLLALSARNSADLYRLAEEITRNYNVEVLCFAADLSDKSQTIKFAELALNKFKKIDVLINNVGKYDTDKVTDENVDFEGMMNSNLNSAYYLSKDIAVKMCENASGHIFNICSVLSLYTRVSAASYTISKHALKGFNDVLREEMREYGVKVTAIYPGAINTSSWEGIFAPKEFFVQTDDIVNIINACLKTSKYANIEEVVIRPLDKKY